MSLTNQFLDLSFIVLVMIFTCKFIMMGDGEGQHPIFKSWTPKIPNLLSLIRIPIAPLIFIGMQHSDILQWRLIIHLSFWIVCILDALDGKFARKWKAVSADGKFLDPFADKVVTFCLAIVAWKFSTLPTWVLTLIIVREVWSNIQRKRMEKLGKETGAGLMGKVKTTIQFTVLYIFALRVMPETIVLERIANTIFSEGFMQWLAIFVSFQTILSFLPFFESFSYLKVEKKNKIPKVALIPNMFTLGNFVAGITAVYFALNHPASTNRSLVILLCLLIAAFLDTFDGPLSRKLKTTSEFGMTLDNVSDFSSFGIATAIVIYNVLISQGALPSTGYLCAGLYLICVHVRLKRFTEAKKSNTKINGFIGVPSPVGCLIAAVSMLVIKHTSLLVLIIDITALMMVCKRKYLKNNDVLKSHPIVFTIGFLSYLATMIQISAMFALNIDIYKTITITTWMLFAVMLLYVLSGKKIQIKRG